MGQNSKIEWTDHTFNPWVGCVKVSPGCKFCYAEELMTRKGRWANTWGPAQMTERIKTSESNWKEPLKWDRQAAKERRRARVFCASLADVFEDNPQVYDWRIQLFGLISETPNLDWQILTKRPEFAREFFGQRPHLLMPNVWIGTSVENQEQANRRIPELLKIPAAIRFLSVEPLLGAIALWPWLPINSGISIHDDIDNPPPPKWTREYTRPDLENNIHWVIIGGESGPNARPFYLGWPRDLIRQCKAAGVPVFMKQLGSNQAEDDPAIWPKAQFFGRFTADKKGGDPDEWPKDLWVREFPYLNELFREVRR